VHVNQRRLRIASKLGEGGFAFVYKVVDDATGEQFALKKVHVQNKEM
jgi:serine/threonine protein kinase